MDVPVVVAVWCAPVVDPRHSREDGQTKIRILFRPLDAKRVGLDDAVVALLDRVRISGFRLREVPAGVGVAQRIEDAKLGVG